MEILCWTSFILSFKTTTSSIAFSQFKFRLKVCCTCNSILFEWIWTFIQNWIVFFFFRYRFYYSGRTELQAVQDSKQRSSSSITPKTFVRSPSKRLAATTTTIGALGSGGGGGGVSSPIHTTGGGGGGSGSDSNGSSIVVINNNGKAPIPSNLIANNNTTSILTITKTSRQHDNKVTSKQMDSMPRKAWEQGNDDEYDIQLLVFFNFILYIYIYICISL